MGSMFEVSEGRKRELESKRYIELSYPHLFCSKFSFTFSSTFANYAYSWKVPLYLEMRSLKGNAGSHEAKISWWQRRFTHLSRALLAGLSGEITRFCDFCERSLMACLLARI